MTVKKSRPILFSGPMVRAILEGQKTQTRRAVKQQPPAAARSAGVISSSTVPNAEGSWWWLDSTDIMDAGVVGDEFRCPYGQPGDRLWVRETWAGVNWEGAPGLAYRADGELADLMQDPSFLDEDGAFNYADQRCQGISFDAWAHDLVAGIEGSWRPSIHMPRWACRLVLEITNVRVERLQDISEAGAVAEGASTPGPFAVHHFADLWNSINGAGAWAADPWVWAITFKRVTP